MLHNRLLANAARKSSRGGFTLVELLVVIGIIAILAGVALGPITNGIKKAKQSTGMQAARSIALLEFQYSVDNDNTYPAGNSTAGYTATGVCIQLLQGKYATDPNVFYVSGPGKSKYTNPTADFSNLSNNNVSWAFTAQTGGNNGTVSGVTSSASDLLPVVFCSGNGPIAYNSAQLKGLDLQLNSNNIYGTDGIAVAYKGNNAVFITGQLSGSSAVAKNFISQSYNDATNYVDLEPQ